MKIFQALVAGLLAVSFALPAPASTLQTDSASWIVQLVPGAIPQVEAHVLAQRAGGSSGHVFDHVLGGFEFVGSPTAAARLALNPRVRALVPSTIITLEDSAGLGVFRIEADQAHQSANGGYTGSGARIIVIDSGIDVDHPDLQPNLDLANSYDCANDDPDPDDDHGHGTHVSGIAAAAYGPSGFGAVGVAPDATIVAIKAFDASGNATTAQVLCGLNRAASVINGDSIPSVVNMSWGEPGSDSVCDDSDGTDVIHEAVCDLADTGAVLVVASGNSAIDSSGFIPAAFDEVITVSGYTDFDGEPGGLAGCSFSFEYGYECDDTFADFANYGADVDAMAPGVQIWSTLPGGTHGTQTGTSMAAPHVSGVVALMLGVDASLTHLEIKQVLQDTGECPDGSVNTGGSTCDGQGLWIDDPDGIPEPLVNALRAAQEAGKTTRWVTPKSDDVLTGISAIEISVEEASGSEGTSLVEWRVDSGAWSAATYNSATGLYQDTWDANSVANGAHTLEVRSTDLDSQVTTDSVDIIVTTEVAGWWALDDGSGLVAVDSSGNGQDGSLVNGPVWAAGRIDGGLSFDGNDDLVELPSVVMDGLGTVTVTMWINTTNTGQQALLSAANTSNDNEFLVFLNSATDIQFYGGEDRGFAASWSVVSVADGQWHHLALVRDTANNEATLYLDGVSQGTQSTTLSVMSVDPGGLILGQEQDSVGGGYDANQALEGTLDDIRIYSRTLTPTEISELATPPPDTTAPSAPSGLIANANGSDVDLVWDAASDPESGIAAYRIYRSETSGSGMTLVAEVAGTVLGHTDTTTSADTTYYYEVTAVNGEGLEGAASNEANTTTDPAPDTTLAGWWALDDGSGLVAVDSSGNGQDGSLVNGPVWAAGRIDGGLSFDGNDDLVELPSVVMDGLGTVTVTMWINTTNTGQQALLSAANTSNDNQFLLYLFKSTTIRFYTGKRASSKVSWSIPSVTDGQWHHLALVRDTANNEATLYLDGVSQGTQSTTLSVMSVDPGGLILGQEQDSVGGGYDANQALEGTLDDIRIYSRTLTPTEISELAIG